MPARRSLLRSLTMLAALTTVPVAAQAPAAADSSIWWVAGDYGYTRFVESLDPWQLGSVSLGHRSRRGAFIARVNAARRFGEGGVQGEVDAWPRLGGRLYAYLNAGVANADVFPRQRYGAELFANLPRAWELSLGARQLRLGGAPVTLFTGSLGRYVGNSWISLRPFAREKDGTLSASLGLTARRYFADADNFVGARVGYGNTPTDRLTPNELVVRASSWSAGVHGSRTLRPRLVGTWALGYEREGLGADRQRRRFEGAIGLRADFPQGR